MTAQTAQPFRFYEQTTGLLSGTLQDQAGVAIPAASVDAITWTLYDLATGTVLNSRNAVDIKNANGGTLDSSGNWTLELTPADNAMLGTATPSTSLTDLLAARGSQPLPIGARARTQVETHVALIQWTYATSKKGKAEIYIDVLNLAKVS